MGALTSRRALGLVLAILVWLVPSRALAQSETTEYYGLDTTGSVRVVFDAAGTVLTRVDYGPFGEQLAAAPGAPNDKYAGLFRDDETGLDYAQARQYNPRIGRFTSLDPVYSGLFEPQRWNRYAYALNSPLVFVDPTGLLGQSPFCQWTSTNDGVTVSCLNEDAQQFLGRGWTGGRLEVLAWEPQGGNTGGRGGTGTTPSTTQTTTTTTDAGTTAPPPTPPTGGNPPNVDPPKTQDKTCYATWQFSALFPAGPVRSGVQLLEFGSVTSLISDIGAIALKSSRSAVLGTENFYAGGLNRAFRSAGRFLGASSASRAAMRAIG